MAQLRFCLSCRNKASSKHSRSITLNREPLKSSQVSLMACLAAAATVMVETNLSFVSVVDLIFVCHGGRRRNFDFRPPRTLEGDG
jgi:hypothetical protein